MNFLVVSSAPIIFRENQKFAYAPYVDELEIWNSTKSNLEISFACPIWNDSRNLLIKEIPFEIRKILKLKDFNLKSIRAVFNSVLSTIKNLKIIFKSMSQADHIHLRCPGNVGLLGCFVQILFPKIPKTVKYAGNWDPNSKQPWSYNLQKWILSNTLLTKNCKVLVYGDWPNQTKNIIPFFTASYYKSEIEELYIRNYTKSLHFCFVGSLVKGKRPELAFEFVKELKEKGTDAIIHFYGDGYLNEKIQKLIIQENAEHWAFVYGNQPKEKIKKALKYSHFLILPSQSEGWPKAVAEAMFWGCIPLVTKVSCVPWMLGHGDRGFIFNNLDLRTNVQEFKNLIDKPKSLEKMSLKASEWSRQYTLDNFKSKIAELL